TTLTNAGGSSGTSDGFVAKLTDAGTSATVAWAQRLGGPGDDGVYGLATSGPNIYVAGFFSGTTTGFGSTTLTSAGGYDVFVSRLTDAGNAATTTWAQRLGGPGSDVPYKLVATGSTLYLAGAFAATVGFGSTMLVSAGGSDGFVARLADTGSAAAVNWAQTVGSPGSDEVTDMAVSGSSLYVTGSFSASVPLGATTLVSAGGTDSFVAKLTDAGSTSAYTWARGMGGLRDDAGYRLATSGGKVYVAGQFGEDGTSTAPASATFGTTVLQSVGGRDIFVTKLIDAGGTSSFAWTQQAGSTYGDTVFGLALSSTSVYVGGYFYGPSIAFGTRTLTNPYPSGGASNGFFASLGDITLPTRAALSATLRLYPNPAAASATVPVPEAAGLTTATLTLTDARGRTVRTAQPAPGTNHLLDLTGLAPGLYVVRVQAGTTLATQQLTVQ
ncbi:MAG: T9SS type A sorting domain-containing protein, partial [Cytophagaceae bacterium]